VARNIYQVRFPESVAGESPSFDDYINDLARETEKEFEKIEDAIKRGVVSYNLAASIYQAGHNQAIVDALKSDRSKVRRRIEAMRSEKVTKGRENHRPDDVKPGGRIIPNEQKRQAVRKYEYLVEQGETRGRAAKIVAKKYRIGVRTLARARKSFATL
jgi:uncharacterized protein YoaH (UPF0181 family)